MFKRITIGLVVVLFVGALGAYGFRRASQAAWVHTTTSALKGYPAPSADMKPGQDGGWVVDAGDHAYMLFGDGWAVFTAHTFHDSERIGDVAIFRASDGTLYISHFHFCVGLAWYVGPPRPKNLQEFLQKYGAEQRWERLPNS